MARPLMLGVISLAAVGLVVALWFWWPRAETDIPQQGAGMPTSAPQGAAPSTAPPTRQDNAVPVVSVSPPPESATDASPETTVEAALDSMSTSLSQGDARTPELAPPFEREKPSPEVLANPDLYAEYELGESKKIAAIYLSMLSQIPVLRSRIEAARNAGSRSTEELAEAEEALAKLEELKREIERDHPEMLPAATPDDATPTTEPAE